jgi:hypothetical protein
MNNLDYKSIRAARRERLLMDKAKRSRGKRTSPNQYEDETHEEFLFRKYGITKVMEDDDE